MRLLSCLLFLLLISSTCKCSTLEDTCKSFADGYPYIGYGYCMKIFQANKASATADKRGLAVIAAKIAKATATATCTRITTLKASEKDTERRDRLGVCAEVYSDAVDQLGEAEEDIARGEADGMQDAVTQLSAALDAPGTCEDAFDEADDTSPLAEEDADLKNLVTMTLAVAAPLSPSTEN